MTIHTKRLILILLFYVLFVSVSHSETKLQTRTMDTIFLPTGSMTLAVPAHITARRSAVTFSHSGHFRYPCSTCHHKWDFESPVKGCSSSGCHNRPKPNRDSNTNRAPVAKDRHYYQDAFHLSCRECHRRMTQENKALEEAGTAKMDYSGVKKFSFLKGGVQGWRLQGYPLTNETTSRDPVRFNINPQKEFIVDSNWVSDNLDNPGVAVVDIRTLDQSKKLAKHPRALKAGRVPGSVKFPVYGLYMDHAELKPPEQLIFALKTRGITPDKTIVLTCNTGAWAGAGFFMLRYLGFEDVRMHDASWVGWEKFVRYPECRYP